jgi:hypothetical protein
MTFQHVQRVRRPQILVQQSLCYLEGVICHNDFLRIKSRNFGAGGYLNEAVKFLTGPLRLHCMWVCGTDVAGAYDFAVQTKKKHTAVPRHHRLKFKHNVFAPIHVANRLCPRLPTQNTQHFVNPEVPEKLEPNKSVDWML